MKIFWNPVSAVAVGLLACLPAAGQKPVAAGSGSYAEFTPLSKGRTDEHGGDQSVLMQSKKLWVTERAGRPIPTNDWWTGLINAPFADALWSYPAMVHPYDGGAVVNYPTYWNDNGTEVKWRSSLTVSPVGFKAESAVAHDWHDWDVEMLQADASGDKTMLTTLVHGQPFTWMEFSGLERLKISASGDAEYFGASKGRIGLKIGTDVYGIYYPADAEAATSARAVNISSDGNVDYVVVALLPSEEALESYGEVALNIPRGTTLGWAYDERRGSIASTWTVDTENLATGQRGGDVMQGFLPHAYKSATSSPAFIADTYLTPRGKMKMARGTEFVFAHAFAGMLPWYAMPSAADDDEHPFRHEVLADLMQRYAANGTFGDDTYWGGKGLTQMALNMTFALEAGDRALFEMSRDKLKAKLIDWLTYTPGEENVYFAFYPRWGGLVGQGTSYDSDTFNDHHFHYGYFTLAGALLCMVDNDFKARYGEMLRLIAKDYANWDRSDTRFPFLRTLDPWVGHSYAGGLGDQGNSNGNGQESSSEAMQGWGGVYLLGVALGDKEMRDAGIFGWSTEARATREYWFDVDARFDRYGQGGNYDHTLFTSPYNTNITCKGIGWWTWFSGDPLHAHGIQWMPISTALDYMSWDREFVDWAYNDMMNTPGWGHKWFENGTNPQGDPLGMLANDDWGNVTLAYMQRARPREAAAIFDEAYARKLGIATAISTGHISYYTIHNHLTYGEIDLTVNADIPSANAFVTDDGRESWIVFNPDATERTVNFYRDGALVKTVKAPAGKMIAVTDDAVLSEIVVASGAGARFPSESTFSAALLDQYGASADGTPQWSVDGPAAISADGVMTWASGTPDGAQASVTARCGDIEGALTVTKGAVPALESASILPALDLVEKGSPVDFTVEALDQYGEAYESPVVWTINGIEVETPHLEADTPGRYEICAMVDGTAISHVVVVTPELPNVALNKNVVTSSEENVGTVARNVNDGERSTRWGSRHNDGEWIYIDLGKDYRLTRVVLDWEAAFASRYAIETAPDGAPTQQTLCHLNSGDVTLTTVAENAWMPAGEFTTASAGKVTHRISAEGRYVRMRSIARGSQYGTSLYEFSVCGVAADAAPGDVIGIDITADALSVDEDKTLALHAMAYRLDGSAVETYVSWAASQGEITADGVFSPQTYGKATVTATASGGVSSSKDIAVNEVVRPKSMTVSPSAVSIASGESVAVDITILNQFGGEYPLSDVEASVRDLSGALSGGVTVDGRMLTAVADGSYVVTFTAGSLSADVAVEVVPFSEYNLALNKPVEVSSKENDGLGGAKAVDGDKTTRWGSQFNDNEWLSVDLLDTYIINRIVITTNDIAIATEALIEYSTDGINWTEFGRRTMKGVGTDDIAVSDVPMRHIRYTGLKRATGYGIGIAELEVYGSGRYSGVESVLASDAEAVNVYTLQGIMLRRGVPQANATAGLPAGVYIVGNRKVVVR